MLRKLRPRGPGPAASPSVRYPDVLARLVPYSGVPLESHDGRFVRVREARARLGGSEINIDLYDVYYVK
jgi:hypothetical protein